MARTDIILWLDLETTGASYAESIVEVGIVATDASPELRPLDEFQSLVEPDADRWRYLKNGGFDQREARDMHRASGLLDDIDRGLRQGTLPTLIEAEGAILHFVRTVAGTSTEHIPLAGSGVGHFDRQFIRRDWPKFDRRLTYWVYDVGVMRRMLRLAGRSALEQGPIPHRALDDARRHVEEARYYLTNLKEAA